MFAHRLPQTEEQVREVNETFVMHYNQERPNQARSCANQPPRVAFAELPSLPQVPDVGDPDRWLHAIDGQHFVRKVRQNGTVLLDNVGYYVKQSLAGQYVDVSVDATTQQFVIWHQHQPYKRVAIKGLTRDSSLFRPLCRPHESTSPLRAATTGASSSADTMSIRGGMESQKQSKVLHHHRCCMVSFCCVGEQKSVASGASCSFEEQKRSQSEISSSSVSIPFSGSRKVSACCATIDGNS